MAEQNNDALKTEELAQLVRDIRDRVRARYPDASNGVARVSVADLMPLVHARDSAEAKVASIGSVNPRPAGPLNTVVQALKRTIARGLDWFVRDQVVFNREIMACVEATLEALNRETREDDTHPSPNDRFRFTRRITSQTEPALSGMVWDLFTNREALTSEMTKMVQGNLGG